MNIGSCQAGNMFFFHCVAALGHFILSVLHMNSLNLFINLCSIDAQWYENSFSVHFLIFSCMTLNPPYSCPTPTPRFTSWPVTIHLLSCCLEPHFHLLGRIWQIHDRRWSSRTCWDGCWVIPDVLIYLIFILLAISFLFSTILQPFTSVLSTIPMWALRRLVRFPSQSAAEWISCMYSWNQHAFSLKEPGQSGERCLSHPIVCISLFFRPSKWIQDILISKMELQQWHMNKKSFDHAHYPRFCVHISWLHPFSIFFSFPWAASFLPLWFPPPFPFLLINFHTMPHHPPHAESFMIYWVPQPIIKAAMRRSTMPCCVLSQYSHSVVLCLVSSDFSHLTNLNLIQWIPYPCKQVYVKSFISLSHHIWLLTFSLGQWIQVDNLFLSSFHVIVDGLSQTGVDMMENLILLHDVSTMIPRRFKLYSYDLG